MKFRLHLFLLTATLLFPTAIKAQSNHILAYQQPATYFEESLVMGNGKLGATIFGGIDSEQIYLNDATLWSGEPVDPYMNPEAYKNIPAIRQALTDGNYPLADQLNKKIQGQFSQSFAPLGTLFLDFNQAAEATNYHRELDISNATAQIHYEIAGVRYSRECFVSHPDQVFVIRLAADKKEALNFSIRFESLLKYGTEALDEIFSVNGYAPYHAEPNYRGEMPEPVRFDADRGTRFSTLIKVHSDGRVTYSDSSVAVSHAGDATIIVSVATSFNGFDKDPAKNGRDHKALAMEQLRKAWSKSPDALRKNHIEDYQNFFQRLSLDLGPTTAPDLPTDERLKRYAQGLEDKNLEILYFQFGRYLLISSSRTEAVPANLQGIWNPYLRPPWSSNYTMNINVEENYWLAESANLSEMHKPFLSFIGNLAQTGKVTAKTFYGIDKGWAACHNSDIWAMSNPVGDFGQGHPVWACWNMSGAWSVTHLWEHYQFSGDREFLEHTAYPLMKGAAEFCLAWLIEDKHGYLITSPSTSPENQYLTPDGYKGATLYGGTADLAMIRECFRQTILAAEELEIDVAFREQLQQALERLHPYQIGKKGNLQEWYHDWEDADPKHRHQSHLYGLYPGHHITPEKTPELADACRTTLEIKGDESTGWSKGWRINLWARLRDGNRSYKMYRELLMYVEPDGARKANYSGGGGTYPNLLDAHPPFQIDGNFGGSAGVVEMLLQSNEQEIHLLPALPDAWQEGSVRGVCARGGFELSFNWQYGHLVGVTVLSKAGENCHLRYQDKRIAFNTEPGMTYSFGAGLKRAD